MNAIGFVGGLREYKLDDGQWHTLRCERTATGVRVTQDAGTSGRGDQVQARGASARINNTNPFMIGGKAFCQAEGVTCDFFKGDLDYVRVEKG